MKDCEQKTSSFLIKLLNMLRSKQNAKTITWDAEQNGIRVFNQKKLQEILLPRYFRHNKYSSFVRQLNMYDFHKVYLQDNTSIFYHQVFNPRDKESVYKIKRKSPLNIDQNIDTPNKLKIKKNQEIKQKKQEINLPKRKLQEPKGRSSFKLLFRNQMGNLRQKKDIQMNTQQVLEQIISQIAPLKLSQESLRQKISQLRKYTRFKKFLKRSSFLQKIYCKLGIQMQRDQDKLSQLSIQQELMFNTKKSLTLRSLKMFESGPINLKDTLGMLMS